MPTRALRAALLAVALILVAAPTAQAARLSSSAATAAAERVAERYADATDAEDHGVDACERRGRLVFACDLFVSIAVDEATQRECTATVTVRLGKRRHSKPVAAKAAWACEDSATAEDDEAFDDDLPEDSDEDVAYEEEDAA
jgi:hypothetical protein